jgi:hypothetical protein
MNAIIKSTMLTALVLTFSIVGCGSEPSGAEQKEEITGSTEQAYGFCNTDGGGCCYDRCPGSAACGWFDSQCTGSQFCCGGIRCCF